MFTSETNQVQGQSRLGFRGSERGDWCGTVDGNRFVLSLDVFFRFFIGFREKKFSN